MIPRDKNTIAVAKYRKKNGIKRIELSFYPQEYAEIKAAADASGESVAGYIKQAIAARTEKDGR